MKARFAFAALALGCAAVGRSAAPPAQEAAPPGAGVVAWADARVKGWLPKPSERRFDEIGWAKDLRAARALSARHNRPVFLFTMDGRINIGRC